MGWSGRGTVEDGRGRQQGRVSSRARAAALAGALLLLGVGVALATSAPAAADDVTVTIKATGLDPASVTVPPGTAITWVNGAGADRFVAADDGTFDSGRLAPNETFQFVFTTERTLSYHVTGQPGQTGRIVVQPGASTTAPAANPFTQGPTTPAAATPDPGLATTGSAETANSVIGGLLLAGGVGLTIWAARRRLSLAWIGSPFGRHDDLLPRADASRRVPRDRGRAPRRSRHRI